MFARRRPRVPQIVFLLVAGFILVNKVDSPQYCLWLLPLAVLARPRWGPLLTWQATELLLTAANFYALVHLDRVQSITQDALNKITCAEQRKISRERQQQHRINSGLL